ncbi:MAG TPA: hypothetical protein VFV82_04955 [Candidatus Binatia bacterium]|nr:hypothetical protein [Candidatus Binatia bacterium]
MSEPKWGIWCVRSGASIVGPGQAWMKKDGKVLLFDTEAEARAEAKRTNEGTRSANLHYSAREFRESFDA